MLVIIGQTAMLVAIVVVAVVFPRPRFEALPEGTERFGFDNGVRWFVLAFAAAFGLAGDYLWVFPHPPQGPNAIYVYVFLADVIPAVLVYSFIYYWALYVDLSEAGIVVSTLYSARQWPYSQIARADISTGHFGKTQRNATMLYDARGRKIVRVTGNFNDYTRFIWLLENGLRHTDAHVRESKDGGAWRVIPRSRD